MFGSLIYFALVVLLLRRIGYFNLQNFNGMGLYAVLVIKMGIAILLFYFPYSTMQDSQIYLHDSEVLSQVFYKSPKDFFNLFLHRSGSASLDLKYMLNTNYWSHDEIGLLSEKRNVIRINALFQFLSFHQPVLIFFWNVLFTILGIKMIYVALLKIVTDKYNLLFLLLFLLPSTLLWTSNIMKENFLLLGTGVFFYGLLVPPGAKKKLLIAFLGLLLIFLFKQYVALGFGLGMLLFFILKWVRPSQKSAVLFGSLLSIFGLTYLTLPKLTEVISKKQFEFINLSAGGILIYNERDLYHIDYKDKENLEIIEQSNKNIYAKIIEDVQSEKRIHGLAPKRQVLKPSEDWWYVLVFSEGSGSGIDVTPINNTSVQLFKNIPEALVNVFLRPWPNDPPHSVFKWYFILENIFIWSLFVLGIRNLRKSNQKPLLLLLFTSIVAIALFIGWTTPVLGAIVRYKLPIVLALITSSWLLLSPRKIQKTEQI